MTMTDPLADMLTRIRNGITAKKLVVECPYSNLKTSVLDVLLKEGFIRGFSSKKNDQGLNIIFIELKYFDGKSVIKEIRRKSKPGLRNYSSSKGLDRVYGGLGISIVSTSRGVMTDHEARQKNIGGEVLCSVF